jgi:hypothetical protein
VRSEARRPGAASPCWTLLHALLEADEAKHRSAMNKQLYENLEHNASYGATLGALETEIDNCSALLSDVEREAAWVYAWALVKRPGWSPNPDGAKGAAKGAA